MLPYQLLFGLDHTFITPLPLEYRGGSAETLERKKRERDLWYFLYQYFSQTSNRTTHERNYYCSFLREKLVESQKDTESMQSLTMTTYVCCIRLAGRCWSPRQKSGNKLHKSVTASNGLIHSLTNAIQISLRVLCVDCQSFNKKCVNCKIFIILTFSPI